MERQCVCIVHAPKLNVRAINLLRTGASHVADGIKLAITCPEDVSISIFTGMDELLDLQNGKDERIQRPPESNFVKICVITV
jgi:hypothetical protein